MRELVSKHVRAIPAGLKGQNESRRELQNDGPSAGPNF